MKTHSSICSWHKDWHSCDCGAFDYPPNEKLEKDFAKIREIQEQAEIAYENDADEFWNSLSKEDQLKCFYSVCKRIHEGDIAKRGTYRYVLYDVFGFGPEAYAVGMNCGYMAIHNGLFPDEESNDFLVTRGVEVVPGQDQITTEKPFKEEVKELKRLKNKTNR